MPRKPKPQLGESWVVEDDEENDPDWDVPENVPSDDDDVDEAEASPPANATPVRQSQRSGLRQSTRTKPPGEPQFIMPSPEQGQSSPDTIRRRQVSSQPPVVYRQPQARKPPVAYRTHAEAAGSSSFDSVLSVLGSTLEWGLDVLAQALQAIKKPLSWLLAVYLFIGLLMLLQNFLTQSIYTALSPICRLPGISLLSLPICGPPVSIPEDQRHSPPEFKELMQTQSQFEDLLDRSVTSISLPSDMKKTETSIRDLKMLVRFSTLPARQELEYEFDSFVETSRTASDQLQKFNAHVGRGVDMVLSNALYTSKRLSELADLQQIEASQRGALSTFFQSYLLSPFRPIKPNAETKVLEQYITHSRVISEQIEQLIAEAQALILILTNLEDRLDLIHAIAVRDGIAAQASKDEILSYLWTKLGGNRQKVAKWHGQLDLLSKMSDVRGRALAHVQGTLLRLQRMGAELEELRTRVGSAEILTDRKDIPIEVHIDAIKMGVERLQMGRSRSREIEEGYVQRVIGYGEKIGLGAGEKDEDGKYIDG